MVSALRLMTSSTTSRRAAQAGYSCNLALSPRFATKVRGASKPRPPIVLYPPVPRSSAAIEGESGRRIRVRTIEERNAHG
jgi:hypothetical protein